MAENRDDEFDFREIKEGDDGSDVVDTTSESSDATKENGDKTEYEDVIYLNCDDEPRARLSQLLI